MSEDPRLSIRDYIGGRLRARGHGAVLADDDPLFSSGRLDSFDAVETVMFLEQEFGVDFSETSFDPTVVDSIEAIAALVETARSLPS